MKRTSILVAFMFLIGMHFSCKGVKNVSGTLKKSDQQNKDYSRNDYTNVQESTVAPKDYVNHASHVSDAPQRSGSAEVGKMPAGESYRKDYGRVSAGGSQNLPAVSPGGTSSNAELNERLVRQYAEMDRLGDLVLYELNIVEHRWDQLLAKYKTASQIERERVSEELDKIGADQLKLYRAYVKIYKDGKSDWVNVKKDVDATLLSIRGLADK